MIVSRRWFVSMLAVAPFAKALAKELPPDPTTGETLVSIPDRIPLFADRPSPWITLSRTIRGEPGHVEIEDIYASMEPLTLAAFSFSVEREDGSHMLEACVPPESSYRWINYRDSMIVPKGSCVHVKVHPVSTSVLPYEPVIRLICRDVP